MQFGFVQGKGTSDAVLFVRQLERKYLAKNESLYLTFFDLESLR